MGIPPFPPFAYVCVCLCIVTAELSIWDRLHNPQSLEHLPPGPLQKILPTAGLEDEMKEISQDLTKSQRWKY